MPVILRKKNLKIQWTLYSKKRILQDFLNESYIITDKYNFPSKSSWMQDIMNSIWIIVILFYWYYQTTHIIIKYKSEDEILYKL